MCWFWSQRSVSGTQPETEMYSAPFFPVPEQTHVSPSRAGFGPVCRSELRDHRSLGPGWIRSFDAVLSGTRRRSHSLWAEEAQAVIYLDPDSLKACQRRWENPASWPPCSPTSLITDQRRVQMKCFICRMEMPVRLHRPSSRKELIRPEGKMNHPEDPPHTSQLG